MQLWCLIREHQTSVGMSAHCTFLLFNLYDLLQFNETAKQCVEQWKQWFDDTMKKKTWDFLLILFLLRCGSPSDTRWCNTSNEESAKG